MDDRGNRKRRLTEEGGQPGQVVTTTTANGSPTPFTPPANKRQFTGSGGSSPLTSAKDDTENMTPAEGVLLNFQKEAIWRQMQEYKRETAKTYEHIEQLEDSQADFNDQINILDTYWNKLLDDINTLISNSRVIIEKDISSSRDENSFASVISQGIISQHQESQEIQELTENAVKPALDTSKDATKGVILKMLKSIESWAIQCDNFWTGYQASDPFLKDSGAIKQLMADYNSIAQQFKKGQIDIDKLQAKCHEYSELVFRLKNELKITEIRIGRTSAYIEDSSEKLRQLEYHINLEKNALTAASSNQGISSFTNITAATLNDMSEASRDELLQFRRLANSRQAEIEEMNLQKTQLKEEINKLRSQLDQLSEEKIQESQHVRGILVQIQSARHEGEFYRSEVLRLRAELEEIRSSRRKFVEILETEEKTRRSTLEAEVKKLENDITRVKDSRDRFQQMYENRCNKDDYEVQQNQEIRKIANTRKDRITTLSAEILRLQNMLATTSDDWNLYAFYLKSPSDLTTMMDLKSKLVASEQHISRLHSEVECTKEAALGTRDIATVKSSESQLQEQVDALSTKLARLESILNGGADDEIKSLSSTVDLKNKTIKRLELRVQAHEAVQTPLLNELHTVANAWGQLEEATSRKAIDLAQKDDLIFKLLSDKTRQESKCSNLIRAKEQSANMAIVMKRQSDMQLDQINRLEDREKTLSQQMIILEKEQSVLNSEVTTQKSKLQEYTQVNSGYKEKFTKQEERLLELQTLLKERSDAFESESASRKKLIEESDSMKRKIEEYAKKSEGGSGDSEASKQAARYLKLLKCPACDVNFKSHVILRCMHVFCKSCMDKQMEYRQRKCPTCRENFGAKDVKEIYL